MVRLMKKNSNRIGSKAFSDAQGGGMAMGQGEGTGRCYFRW